jgi:DNA modification methylase
VIHHGDLFDVLPTLDAESIDACVTDPPYGIAFMGKDWDNFRRAQNAQDAGRDSVMGRLSRTSPASGAESDRRAFQEWSEGWGREVFRVLKPGAHLLAFGATRNYHRMVCGLENAGFEVRDCFAWLFGSGFPKNKNLGDGRGTALKPAHEPIALAWKPFKGSIAANVAKYGTGALNIEACRIGTSKEVPASMPKRGNVRDVSTAYGDYKARTENGDGQNPDIGRWPANVLLDEEAAALLDEQTGELVSGARRGPNPNAVTSMADAYDGGWSHAGGACDGSVGGASRFYYVAKPSREERDYGTDGLIARQRDESRKEGNPGGDNPRNRGLQPRGNFHPTVKPVELMRWLVKLVTPPGGTVLDPFTGSGTTGMACRYEQREFIGIEREAEYLEIAKRRIAAVVPLFAEMHP